MQKWYQLKEETVISDLKSNKDQGLCEQEVARRLKEYGPNVLREGKKETLLQLFFKQFFDPLIYLLIVAALLVLFIGEYMDAVIIFIMLFINAVVSAVQEGRAQDILSSLKKMIITQAVVIRDGQVQLIEDKFLVPGDIIKLESGARVPADVRLLVSYDLGVDESMLTGESEAVSKKSAVILKRVPIYQMDNMLFMGSTVVSGSGLVIVVKTGQSTEIGKLQKEIEQIDTQVPIEKELASISKYILIAAVLISVGLFIYGWWAEYSLYELFITLTVMFVAIVPEELMVVLTMILVGGAARLSKHKILVKRLRAVEALGHAEVIVMDKTGTLTRNEMVVEKAYAGHQLYSVSGQGYQADGRVTIDDRLVSRDQDVFLYEIARAAILLNAASIHLDKKLNQFEIKGSATTAAARIFSYKLERDSQNLVKEYTEIYRIPFNSRKRFSAGLYEYENSYVAYIAGSPEIILENAHNVVENDKKVFEELLAQGYRMVAYGRYVEDKKDIDNPAEYLDDIIKKPVEFLGFIAIQDALRKEAPAMIDQARRAGLEVVMATGDHEKTARFIGIKTGILSGSNAGLLNGPDFRNMTDEDLLKRLDDIHVYSRVTPSDKLRLIGLFHEKDKTVAMAGDGVNDAPALIAADLGIAMGERGSSVAHEAADMVLLDDSFATIIEAIKEGRHIFYRLRQGVLYFVITDFALILLMFLTIVMKLPLALTAIQVMWIHVFSDGFFSIALAREPVEPGLLEKKWLKYKNKQKLLDKKNVLRALYLSLPMTLITLWYFLIYYQDDLVLAQTIVFASLTLFKWYNAWNCRSETQSIFRLGLFSNRALMISLFCVAFLLLIAIYIPALQPFFSTKPLSLSLWIKLFVINSVVIFLEEGRKYYFNKKG